MEQRQTPPEGTPISQKEWDKLSEASRRWLLELVVARGGGANGLDGVEPVEDELDPRDGERRKKP